MVAGAGVGVAAGTTTGADAGGTLEAESVSDLPDPPFSTTGEAEAEAEGVGEMIRDAREPPAEVLMARVGGSLVGSGRNDTTKSLTVSRRRHCETRSKRTPGSSSSVSFMLLSESSCSLDLISMMPYALTSFSELSFIRSMSESI